MKFMTTQTIYPGKMVISGCHITAVAMYHVTAVYVTTSVSRATR